MFRTTTCLFAALMVSACAGQKAQTIGVDSRPRVEPTSSSTVFRTALKCLDGQLTQRRMPVTDLVLGRMPDATGQFPLSMRDMTIHAIVTATQRSGAFRVIDQNDRLFAQLNPNVALPSTVSAQPANLAVSSFNLSGSIVSAAKAIYAESAGFGVGANTAPGGNAGLSYLSQLSSVETGMRLSRMGTNETLYSSQHQMTLRQTEFGLDARAGFADYGVSAGLSFDRQDSPAKAVQTLVELHVLELLGKAANVPYWECLAAPGTNPGSHIEISDGWSDLSATEREAVLTRDLMALGYAGRLRDMIQRFQIDNGLNVSGRVNFETFLAARQLRKTGGGAAVTVPISAPSTTPAPAVQGGDLTVRAEDLGLTWRVQIGLRKSAFVACYYKSDDGVIAQIYPNRFNRSRWLSASAAHFVPDTVSEKNLYIRGRAPEFLCLASDQDPSARLPSGLRQAALQDLRQYGIVSFRQIVDSYKAATNGRFDWDQWKK